MTEVPATHPQGTPCWVSLLVRNLPLTQAFYGELFGWEIAEAPDMSPRYLMINNRGANNGGMIEPIPPGTPPHWLAYFGVSDTEEALGRAGELGGAVLAGPIELPMAKIGVVRDPQGAVFAIYAGALEP